MSKNRASPVASAEPPSMFDSIPWNKQIVIICVNQTMRTCIGTMWYRAWDWECYRRQWAGWSGQERRQQAGQSSGLTQSQQAGWGGGGGWDGKARWEGYFPGYENHFDPPWPPVSHSCNPHRCIRVGHSWSSRCRGSGQDDRPVLLDLVNWWKTQLQY